MFSRLTKMIVPKRGLLRTKAVRSAEKETAQTLAQDLARADDDGFAAVKQTKDAPIIHAPGPGTNYKERLKELGMEGDLKYTESIVNTTHDPFLILYEDFTVALASLSFYKTFKVKPRETEGQLIYNLGNRQWDIPKLRQLLEEILPKTSNFDNFEIEHDFLHIGTRIMLLNARRIYLPANHTKLIVITIKDVTERKKREEL